MCVSNAAVAADAVTKTGFVRYRLPACCTLKPAFSRAPNKKHVVQLALSFLGQQETERNDHRRNFKDTCVISTLPVNKTNRYLL